MAQTPKKNPVVVVIFDEFSTASLLDKTGKAIHKKRFPNFHRLSREGAWYRKHTTVADFTTRAVPAILTGRSKRHVYADYRRHPESLYSFFGAEGYGFRNMEIYTQLCPPTRCRPPGPRFLTPLKGEPPDDFGLRILNSIVDRNERRARWIKGLRRLAPNQVAMGHILLPHGPYHLLPNGKSYRQSLDHGYRNSRSRTRTGSQGLVDSHEQRALFHVGYTDRILGSIINSIKRSGLWKKTMLIVTGDHGTSFKPGLPARKVVAGNRHEIGLTPLLIKFPDQAITGRQEIMAQTTDILPTIAKTLGLQPPFPMDGQPLSEAPQRRTVTVGNEAGESFPITDQTAEDWLTERSRDQARRLGTRGLDALGPLAKEVGRRAPKGGLKGGRGVSIADLATLTQRPRRGRPPALVQGFVTGSKSGKRLGNGSRLLLSLEGRFVSSASVYPFSGKRAFTFLIHPKYLGSKGLKEPRVFQVLPSGRKVRVR